jgi:hypothetical protein
MESPGLPVIRKGPVRAVMYTLFEDVEGYVVGASDPPNVMVDQFKDIGYQFLPDKGICWRLISLSIADFRITGVPVHIDDAKYARRAFVFCFCLVVDKRAAALAKVAAQYLAETFHELETKHSFLSNEENHGKIVDFLLQLRDQLNTETVSFINMPIAEGVSLQFSKPVKPLDRSVVSTVIQPWHIPIATVAVTHMNCVELQPFLTVCDGEATVSEISLKLELELTELSSVLLKLVERKLLAIMDQPIDKFSRVRLTSEFHTFFDDLTNRQTAVAFAMNHSLVSGHTSMSSSVSSSPRSAQPVDPSGTNLGDQLVRIYCRLDGHVEDLGEFSATQGSSGLSIRLMVIFGILKNFIRTKAMFPVFMDHETTMIPVLRSCDGSRTWDEIGFKHGFTREEMHELFQYHGVVRIWR